MLKQFTKRLTRLKSKNLLKKQNFKRIFTSGSIQQAFSKRRRNRFQNSQPRSATGTKGILIDQHGNRTTKPQRKHKKQINKDEQYLSFKHLNLLTSLHEYLESEEIYTPTSIQNNSIHSLLTKNHNFFIGSATGSGKTLCYLLPIFQLLKEEELISAGENVLNYIGPKQEKNEKLKKIPGPEQISLPFYYQYLSEKEKQEYQNRIKKEFESDEKNPQGQKITMQNRPRVLIVMPSRELVQQVTGVAKEIGKYCKLGILGLGIAGRKNQRNRRAQGKVKGMFRREKEELDRGVDIVIGTANRIELHLNKRTLLTGQLRHIVIDEADTVIDAGNAEIMSYLMRLVANEEEIQERGGASKAIFVSATLNGSLDQFINAIFSEKGDNRQDYQTLEKIIDPGTHLNLSHINHNFNELTDYDKHDQFLEIMGDIDRGKKDKETCIIFCNTVASCRSTEYVLRENGFEASSIHGEVPAKARIQNYERFKKGELNYLVSTDLASRGLDFRNNGYVVNFDFPRSVSDYLHRVGRTGRAGKPGTAFSLVRKKDMKNVHQIRQSYEYGIPLAIGSSSYTMKNRELLRERQKLERGESKKGQKRGTRLEQVKRQLQMQDSSPNNFVDFNQQTGRPRKMRKVKGAKKRPESKEKKAYKRILKQEKNIPKSQRHQKTKIMKRLKKRKKKVVKIMKKQKDEGYSR